MASLSLVLSHGLCLYSFNAQNYSLSKYSSQKYWHRRHGISGYRAGLTWKLRCIASYIYAASRPQFGIISGMTRTESTIANWPRGVSNKIIERHSSNDKQTQHVQKHFALVKMEALRELIKNQHFVNNRDSNSRTRVLFLTL